MDRNRQENSHNRYKKAFDNAWEVLKSIHSNDQLPDQDQLEETIKHGVSDNDQTNNQTKISGTSLLTGFVTYTETIYNSTTLNDIEKYNASIPQQLKIEWLGAKFSLISGIRQCFGFAKFKEACNTIACPYSRNHSNITVNNQGIKSVPRLSPYSYRDLNYAVYYLKIIFYLTHNDKSNVFTYVDDAGKQLSMLQRNVYLPLLLDGMRDRIIASKLSILHTLLNEHWQSIVNEKKTNLIKFYEQTLSQFEQSTTLQSATGVKRYISDCNIVHPYKIRITSYPKIKKNNDNININQNPNYLTLPVIKPENSTLRTTDRTDTDRTDTEEESFHTVRSIIDHSKSTYYSPPEINLPIGCQNNRFSAQKECSILSPIQNKSKKTTSLGASVCLIFLRAVIGIIMIGMGSGMGALVGACDQYGWIKHCSVSDHIGTVSLNQYTSIQRGTFIATAITSTLLFLISLFMYCICKKSHSTSSNTRRVSEETISRSYTKTTFLSV